MPLTSAQTIDIVNKYQMRMSDMYRLSQGELFSIPPSRLGLSGGDVLRILLQGSYGDLLEAKHSSGATLLHIAAKYGDDQLVDAILSRDFSGTYVNAITNNGRNPAQVAIASRKYEILEKLISKGADLFHSNGSESAFVSMFRDAQTKVWVVQKINQDLNYASNLYHELNEMGENHLCDEVLVLLNPEFRGRVILENAETASIESAELVDMELDITGELSLTDID